MMPTPVTLSIVIVTWNSEKEISRCCASITGAGIDVPYEVIVVDNHSSDATVRTVREAFPTVTVIENSTNAGFAAANNQAFRTAKGVFLLLLNPDTEVRSGALTVLLEYLRQNPDVWIAGPAMVNPDGSIQRTGVRFPSNWNLFCEAFFLDRLFPASRIFGRHREMFADDSRVRFVDYLQGSCLMFRSDMIRIVGELDEQYFLYFEETDWCYRVRKAGGKVAVIPDAVVMHEGGGTAGHFDERRITAYHASLLLFYRKWYSSGTLKILQLILSVRSCIRIVVWLSISMTRPYLRSRAVSALRGYRKTFPIIFRGQ